MSPDEIVGILCLIGGAVLCLFGSKYQECTLSFFGSGVGAYIFYLISSRLTFGFATQIVLSVLVSLLFSFICMKFTRLSVLLIAIIHSLCIANLMAPGLGSFWGSFVTYAVLIILPALFLYAPEVGILASSSFFGSWIFVTGIEQFIGSGFPNPLIVLFNRNWDTVSVLGESAFLECLLVCSVMITSLVIQIKTVTYARYGVMQKLLDEVQEKVIAKLIDIESGLEISKDPEQKLKLLDLLIDIEVTEQFRGYINSNASSSSSKPSEESVQDDNMVTPGGDDENIKDSLILNNSDKKGYFLEKLVGSSESSKPLL